MIRLTETTHQACIPLFNSIAKHFLNDACYEIQCSGTLQILHSVYIYIQRYNSRCFVSFVNLGQQVACVKTDRCHHLSVLDVILTQFNFQLKGSEYV